MTSKARTNVLNLNSLPSLLSWFSSAAISVSVESSVYDVRALVNGSFSPSTVTFSAFKNDTSNIRTAYAGRFVVATSTNGVNYTTQYTSSSDESTYTYTVPSGAAFIRVQVFRSGGGGGVLAQDVVNIWTTVTPATDITGQLIASQIANAAITTAKFALTIEPVSLVSSVPGTKSTEVVFNTSDGKLYRWNGIAYTAAIPTSDLSGSISDGQISGISSSKLIGQIVGTQITDGAISTPKLASNSVTTAILAANAVTAGQIAANTITAGQIAAGAIGATEIAAGAINASKIAANTITADKIAANTITAAQIAASTITASQIATGTITATNIAATTITAAQLASNAVTADKILAGSVTAAKLESDLVLASTVRTASSGFRTEISNVGSYPIWYGTGTKNDTNGLFYVKTDGSVYFKGTIGSGSVVQTFTITSASASGSASGFSPTGTVTATASVTLANGTAPYTYAWSHISTTAGNTPTISSATSSAPVFSATCTDSVEARSVWQIKVTDTNGNVATANAIVTLLWTNLS